MKPSTLFTAALACTTFGLAACGDNNSDDGDDDGVDAATTDAPNIDARDIDAPDPFVAPTPFAIPLSAAGPDQLQSAAAGPGGTFYAAGYAAQTATGPRLVTVVQFSTTGPVNTFGAGGVATTALEFRGGADEVDVAVQSTGKILVSATVANATNPADRDIAVTRLNADGTLDATFGVAGVRILDLSTAADNGSGGLTAFDGVRSMVVGPADVIYLHGLSRAEGAGRTDTDFTVVKLSADGTQDMAFGGDDGKFTLDLQETNATARGVKVLADGSVLAGGYANTPGLGSTQIVMYKLDPDGELVTGFANQGVFHDIVLAIQTETYNFALHDDQIVTAGYGRDSGNQNDWISLRFDQATGARDTTWGAPDFTDGRVLIDPSGTMVGDNCRNALALSDGGTVLVGSSGSGVPAQNAAVAILDADGRLDTRYGTGIHLFTLGADGADQFWGAAQSGGAFVLVGYKGAGQTQTDTNNDDAYGVIFPLR